jgi:1-acyl-sn-glycerol-3-phosphate acyltransferase
MTQHMSFLIADDDRVPLLGLAWRAARESGREPQESVVIRNALRIGVRELLDELEPAERAEVERSGRDMLTRLDERPRRGRRKSA